MKVILISGKAGHGKDTIGEIIKEKLEQKNYRAIILHFADLVKFYASHYFNWDGNKGPEGRALLQEIGNNSFRRYDDCYWGRITAECAAVMGIFFHYDFVIVPDTRYPNEIQVMKQYNNEVYCVRVQRFNEYGLIWDNPNLTEEQKQNEGEVALDNYKAFDKIIYNYHLEALDKSAADLVQLLTEK